MSPYTYDSFTGQNRCGYHADTAVAAASGRSLLFLMNLNLWLSHHQSISSDGCWQNLRNLMAVTYAHNITALSVHYEL